MTQPNSRAELQALLTAIEIDVIDCNAPKRFEEAVDRAMRAALAANPDPAPVAEGGPSDEELLKLYCDTRRAFYFKEAKGESDQGDRKDATVAGLRAVLARYGTPTPAPVPVAERLPEERDCLVLPTGPGAEHEWWCWFYVPGLEGTGEWRCSTTPRLSAYYGWQGISHWLQWWALPLPAPAEPTTPPEAQP